MTPELPSSLLREGLSLLLTVGSPLFAAALGVGLLVGVLQAATQINDPASGFLPPRRRRRDRLLAGGAVDGGAAGRLPRDRHHPDVGALMTLPVASAWACILLLFRTAGLLLTAPVLSARVVPARVRVALAVLLAWAAWTGAGAPGAPPPEHMGSLAGAAAAETALGMLAGLAARFVLQAALAAGHLASTSMGLGYGAMLDPASGAESNTIGELVYTAAQAGAVALGIHREAVAWLARSAVAFPPGAGLSLRELMLKVVWESTGAAALGARLAFPMLSAVLIGHLVMAAMGRTAQQLNLGTIGFSTAIVAGGGALYLVAPSAAEMAARAAFAAMASG